MAKWAVGYTILDDRRWHLIYEAGTVTIICRGLNEDQANLLVTVHNADPASEERSEDV